MKTRKVRPVDQASADILAEQIERLKELVPEAVTEAKVDFEKLKAALGEIVDDSPERYSFSWAGKRDAVRLLQVRSRATLKPCPEESVNWERTKNIFIEGENLEVLKLLYKSHAGRVKMIYIDPPYNTGNDFIYPDNFADPLETYLKLTGQKDAEGNLLTSNPETSGRYHSAWLSMMYPRLFVARQLLREDGVIFVSIDDNEAYNLRMLMNEIFGEENFLASIVWQKRTSPDARAPLGPAHDYLVVYARSLDRFKEVCRLLPLSDERKAEHKNPDNDPRGPWASVDLTGQTGHATLSQFYEIVAPNGTRHKPPQGRCWAIAEETLKKLVGDNRIWFGPDGSARPRLKRYLSDAQGSPAWTWWTNQEVGHNQEATKELNRLLAASDVFDNPKPTRLLTRVLQLSTDPLSADIVLDFFSGSCTAAHAVLQLNREDGGDRRFMMVQLPEPTPEDSSARRIGYESIADIGKERIRRVIKKLKDELTGQLELKDRETPEDLGFRVFKLAESNYRQWRGVEEKGGEEYVKEMELFTDPLLPGWKPEDVAWEVALKEGYSLSSSVEEVKEIQSNRVWRVTDPDRGQFFLICLDDKLKDATVRALKLGRDDLFVCRDGALTDEQAANLALQCKLKTI